MKQFVYHLMFVLAAVSVPVISFCQPIEIDFSKTKEQKNNITTNTTTEKKQVIVKAAGDILPGVSVTLLPEVVGFSITLTLDYKYCNISSVLVPFVSSVHKLFRTSILSQAP